MYCIERAQPVYQYLAKGESELNPNLYWYQEHYYEDYYDDYVQGDDDFEGLMNETAYKQVGRVYDVSEYEMMALGEVV